MNPGILLETTSLPEIFERLSGLHYGQSLLISLPRSEGSDRPVLVVERSWEGREPGWEWQLSIRPGPYIFPPPGWGLWWSFERLSTIIPAVLSTWEVFVRVHGASPRKSCVHVKGTRP